MSSGNYVGQGTLPPELEQRVQSELSGGERLVYVGQPRPDLYRGQTACLSIFGLFFGGVAVFMLAGGVMSMAFGRIGGGGGAANGVGAVSECFPLVFCLFTIPFIAVGAAMASAPLWMRKRIRRIIYALTDRRALIFEPNWFGQNYTVRNYTREALGRMYRVEKSDGAGHLVFEEYYTTSTNTDGMSSTQRNQRGFMAIERVRDVEELVRLTLGL